MSDNTITLDTFSSPLGIITTSCTSKGVCLIEFDNQKRIDKHLEHFTQQGFEVVHGKHDLLNHTSAQLTEYFDQKRTAFDIPLHLSGSEFQMKVWKTLQHIPFGQTSTYKQQANALGDPLAIRAMATANGANKISIIIPCHRVIGSDGSLTGYGGGIWRKQFLLDLESQQHTLF